MFVFTVALGCLILIMVTAGFRTIPGWLNISSSNQKRCNGYTIIAFDKGIDCQGDTIRLVRENGFARKAEEQQSAHRPALW